jgi:hypothetical protein
MVSNFFSILNSSGIAYITKQRTRKSGAIKTGMKDVAKIGFGSRMCVRRGKNTFERKRLNELSG